MSTNLGQKAAHQRPDLARRLLAQLDRLSARLGDVSVAAEIQLLKRELVRGHAILAACPEDNNYLSVITLVEGALASLTWKGYAPPVIEVLRRAFSAGVSEGEFTLDAYDAIRRDFKTSGVSTGPTIDLTAAEGEDEHGSQA